LAEAQRIEDDEKERRRMAEEARAVEMAKARELEEEARLRLEAEERERQEPVLAQVRELVANGYLKEAEELYGGVKKRLSGLDYRGVVLALNQALAEATRLESGLKESIAALESAVSGGLGFAVFPPLLHRHECRAARGLASKAIAEVTQYLTSKGGSSREALGKLLQTAKELDQQVSHTAARAGRLVRVVGGVWLAVIVLGAAMAVGWQAQQKRRAVAAEAAIASKVGLSRPFAQGARGQAGVIFVRWIPAGRFMMGSPRSEAYRILDEVQHEVVLSHGFFMAETECTQGQWEMVMGSNPSNFKGANRPVEQVSWSDAVEYCRKLTVKQRDEGLLPVGWEWRLPTESEWEYAVRAGTTGPRYGELEETAWWSGNSGSETHPVSQKAANAWGLQDMMGNVLEWCSDWSEGYPTGSVTDPRGPSSGSGRVVRGGSWGGFAKNVRSALRIGFVPGGRDARLGFRPVLSSVGLAYKTNANHRQ
jgi:formylglycine-generating enzyme required for sulfatase activity